MVIHKADAHLSSMHYISRYRSAQSIRDIYLNDMNNNGGKKAAKNGIYIDNDGYLFLPLKIYLPGEGDLNIIPVDYFVNATIKIIENCSQSGIFHLTNNSPTTMKIVAKYYEQLMKVRGVEIIYGKSTRTMLKEILLKNCSIVLLNHTVLIYLITEFSTEQILTW